MKKTTPWLVSMSAMLCLMSGCIIVVDGEHDSDCDEDSICSSAPITQTYTLDEFSSVSVTGSASVAVEWCEDCEPSVSVTSAGENASISSAGGALTISGSGSEWWDKPAIFVKTRRLSELSVTGSGHIKARGIECESLSLRLTGSGRISVRGHGESVSVLSTGSGNIKAGHFHVHHASVTASGSGDVSLCADRGVTGTTSGSGNLDVYCQPEVVDVLSAGSGNVDVR